MTDEQQRTLDYYQERYEHAVRQQVNGYVKTTADWHQYEQARLDYYGYVAALRRCGIDIDAA